MHGLRSLVLLALFTACAHPHIGTGVARLDVQSAHEPGLRLLAFDESALVTAIPSIERAQPTAAALYPNGDWFIVLGGSTALRLAPNGLVRWYRDTPINEAVVVSDDLVVGTNVIPTGEGSDEVELVALRGDGSPAWRAAGAVVRANVRLVRATGATIVTYADGERAVSDSGKILWTHEHTAKDGVDTRSEGIHAVYVEGAGLVVLRRPPLVDGEIHPPALPLTLQLLDARTGAALANTEIGVTREQSEHLPWTLVDVAVVGNRVLLVTKTAAPYALETFHVVTVKRDGVALVEQFVATSELELAQIPRLEHDEVATPRARGNSLDIELVGLATHRVRHVHLAGDAPYSLRGRSADPSRTVDVFGNGEPFDHASPSGSAHASSLHIGFRRRTDRSIDFTGSLSGTLLLAGQRFHADIHQSTSMDGATHFDALKLVGTVSPSR